MEFQQILRKSSCRLVTLAYIGFQLHVLKAFVHNSDQGTRWDVHSLDVNFLKACLMDEIESGMCESCNFTWNKKVLNRGHLLYRLWLTNSSYALNHTVKTRSHDMTKT
jgi:hypothetical protein